MHLFQMSKEALLAYLQSPRFEFDCAYPIGNLSSLQPDTKKRKTPATGRSSSRHVAFDPGQTYALIRPGSRNMSSVAEIAQSYEDGTCHESDWYLFCATDPLMTRDGLVPKYEAAYRIVEGGGGGVGRYVRVQKRLLKTGYKAAGRVDKKCAWQLLSGGEPYWVDRHLYCTIKQQGGGEKKKRG